MPSSPFTPQLRPLSVGEILDAGFRLMRARFGTLMACVLVPVVPISILAAILVASIDPTTFDVNASGSDDGNTTLANLLDSVLNGAAGALAIAACFKAISSAYLGEQTSAGESLRYGLSRFLPIIVAYIVVSIVVGIGLILLLVPGLFLGTKWSLTFAAIVAERKGPFAGMGRSWELTRGHFWRTFGTLVVVFLLAFVLAIAIFIALGVAVAASDSMSEVTFAVLTILVTIIVYALIYPITASIITVLYYDLRVRNEAFDLQLLARGVGADASRFASAPERPGPVSTPPPSGGGFAPPEGPATTS